MTKKKFQVENDIVYVPVNSDIYVPPAEPTTTQKRLLENADKDAIYDINGKLINKQRKPRSEAQLAATARLVELNRKRAEEKRAKKAELDAQVQKEVNKVNKVKLTKKERELAEQKRILEEKVKSGELIPVRVNRKPPRKTKQQPAVIIESSESEEDELLRDLKQIEDNEPITDTELDTELPSDINESDIGVRQVVPKTVKRAVKKIKEVKEKIKEVKTQRGVETTQTMKQTMKQIPNMAKSAVANISELINSRWK